MRQKAASLRIFRNAYGDNTRSFLVFELLYGVCLTAGLYPSLRIFISWIIRISGFGYLTAENALRFLRNPAVLLLLLALFLLWTAVMSFGITGAVFLERENALGCRRSAWDALIYSLRSTATMFSPEHASIRISLILILTVMHLPNVIRIIRNFIPPDFWTEMIRGKPLRIAAITILLSAAVILFIGLRFSFHFWNGGEEHSEEAHRNSVDLVRSAGWKKGIFYGTGRIIAGSAVLFACYFLLLVVLTVLTVFIGKTLHVRGDGISSFVVILQKICFSVYDAVSGPVILSILSIEFRLLSGDPLQTEEILPRAEKVRSAEFRYKNLGRFKKDRLLLFLSILVVIWYMISSARGRYLLRVEGLETMQITAHRGASVQCPENTMAAFREAVEQEADWIELDVQESADGVIFVMHDSNFKRTTGRDANVWELNWDEIRTLDAGARRGDQWKGEPIPLLDEVLAFASEEGVNLNIELKPTGHEKRLVEGVMELIEKYQYEDSCVITSQSYRAIKEVRDLSDVIHTAYVCGLAYGAVSRLTAADAFSVQSVSISRKLVRSLHNRGIAVYAWTVNSRKSINRMIDYGVDNIITDNVPLARRCLNENQTSGFLGEVIRSVNGMFS